ncbi:MAG: hypothetical protein J5J00_12385 [Deltaproteobacteria bacterium]|nr:hypothetical protein [Deltaproteobacteria bacterium]
MKRNLFSGALAAVLLISNSSPLSAERQESNFYQNDYARSVFSDGMGPPVASKRHGRTDKQAAPQTGLPSDNSNTTAPAPQSGSGSAVSLAVKCPSSEVKALKVQSLEVLYDFRVTDLSKIMPVTEGIPIEVFSIIADETTADQQRISNDRITAFLKGAQFRRDYWPKEAQGISKSPAFIIHTDKGKILLEGVTDVDQFISEDATIDCQPQ